MKDLFPISCHLIPFKVKTISVKGLKCHSVALEWWIKPKHLPAQTLSFPQLISVVKDFHPNYRIMLVIDYTVTQTEKTYPMSISFLPQGFLAVLVKS